MITILVIAIFVLILALVRMVILPIASVLAISVLLDVVFIVAIDKVITKDKKKKEEEEEEKGG